MRKILMASILFSPLLTLKIASMLALDYLCELHSYGIYPIYLIFAATTASLIYFFASKSINIPAYFPAVVFFLVLTVDIFDYTVSSIANPDKFQSKIIINGATEICEIFIFGDSKKGKNKPVRAIINNNGKQYIFLMNEPTPVFKFRGKIISMQNFSAFADSDLNKNVVNALKNPNQYLIENKINNYISDSKKNFIGGILWMAFAYGIIFTMLNLSYPPKNQT